MRISNKDIQFHASPSLYRDWCNRLKVSMTSYPYAVLEHPKVNAPPIVYAVWEYGHCKVDGKSVRQLYITYKAVRGKHNFTKFIYY